MTSSPRPARLGEVVRGHDDLRARGVEGADERLDLARGARVQARGGFVEEEHLTDAAPISHFLYHMEAGMAQRGACTGEAIMRKKAVCRPAVPGATCAALSPPPRRRAPRRSRRRFRCRRRIGPSPCRLWFEVEANAFLRSDGAAELRLDAENDIFLGQRLILQPRLETRMATRSDPERSLGRGSSRRRHRSSRALRDQAGIRALRRGATEPQARRDFARRDGKDVDDLAVVAGIRVWY